MESSDDDDGFDFPWEIGIFDAHCHPTDTMSNVPDISKMKAQALTIMATRGQDQDLVADVANDIGMCRDDVDSTKSTKVVPSFGWHPWFSHQIFVDEELHDGDEGSSMSPEKKIAHYQAVLNPKSEDREFLTALPDPLPLSRLIAETEERLKRHPHALVGEVGLDKAFRIPQAWIPEQTQDRDDSLTPGGREGRRLSPYRVAMDHQRQILLAQFKLAGKLQRAVSVHGVQAHGVLYETVRETWRGHELKVLSKRERKRRASAANAHANENSETLPSMGQEVNYPPRVCLHSYSGPTETIRQYMNPENPVKIFVSFSIVINFSTVAFAKTEEVIKAVPDDRILIESDMHMAGSKMDSKLRKIAEKICALKGWQLSEGLRQLKDNWKDFVFGERD